MTCETEKQIWLAAEQAASDAFATEDAAAEQVAIAAAALEAAEQGLSDATGAADAAQQEAIAKYNSYLDCVRS